MLVVPVAAVVKVAELPVQASVDEAGCWVMVSVGVVTVKSVALVAVFPPTVTLIGPVVAPIGTVTVRVVGVLTVTSAVVPLNVTVLLVGVLLKLVPVMVTVIPTGPEEGVKLEMVGGPAKAHTEPEGASPVMVQPFVVVKLLLAATALVPYCLPVASSVRPLGVDGLLLQPINVAE